MTDNMNPNSNFHPYQPPDAVPVSDQPERGLAGLVEKAGIDPAKFRNFTARVKSMNARDWLDRGRSFASGRGGLALGGLATAAIVLGLMRGRGMNS